MTAIARRSCTLTVPFWRFGSSGARLAQSFEYGRLPSAERDCGEPPCDAGHSRREA